MNEQPMVEAHNLEGVNITLKFMQRDIGTLSGLIKEIGGKIDTLPSGFVSIKEFNEAKNDSEKDRADLKAEVKELTLEQKSFKEFKDTLTGKMWGIGVVASVIAGIISVVVNHLWK